MILYRPSNVFPMVLYMFLNEFVLVGVMAARQALTTPPFPCAVGGVGGLVGFLFCFSMVLYMFLDDFVLVDFLFCFSVILYKLCAGFLMFFEWFCICC